jgi:quercetin dioxygenase-like cupin family protein
MSKPLGAIPFYGCHILPVPLHGEGRTHVNPHRHDEAHAMALIDGAVEITIGDAPPVVYRPIVVPAGVTHSVRLLTPHAQLWCVFK